MVIDLFSHKSLLISGPCSAETREQVLSTAAELAALNRVHLFRAGVWKPRTLPGSFEGVGEVALPWLKEVQTQYQLPVTIEVAQVSHVEKALAAGMDVLWLGARTTVNPFSVQQIADALTGTDIPVMIKNPLSPDIDLWTGAVERIRKAGIRQIALIHRGFSTFNATGYRNPPMWHIAIEMKRRFPELPMICDPSHICGNREGLSQIAQRSIDLDFSGLMIESHVRPDEAWSDAFQQITPEGLSRLLEKLIWRTGRSEAGEHLLEQLREQVDRLDDELLQLLHQRMKLADRIGVYKKQNNMTILQTERWNAILERALAQSDKLELSRDFILRYLETIHLESISHQNKVMNE